VDYKILARAIAKRGFIKGRFIGQNVRLLSDLVEFTDNKKFQEYCSLSILKKLSTP